MLRLRAEPHDALHPRAVVPRAVKEHDLTRSREMLDIALKIPRGGLSRRGLLQRHRARATGIQVFVEAFNGTAFSCGIATFEKNDMALTRVLCPVLPLQQLNLQSTLDVLVLIAAHAFLVRVVFPPRLHRLTVRLDKDGVILIRIINDVTLSCR